MWERTFLRDLAVVLAASFPVLFVCRRLRLPQVVGFLVTGVVIGPHALGWVREASRVESIAEFGVALILLFVGLEFPLRRLKALGRTALVGGTLQMALTAGAGYALARARGRTRTRPSSSVSSSPCRRRRSSSRSSSGATSSRLSVRQTFLAIALFRTSR